MAGTGSRGAARARRLHMRSWHLAAAVALSTGMASAQTLGHRLGGSLGLDAGRAPPAGLYVADRLVVYRARRLNDRHGERVPLDLDLDIVANAAGAAAGFDAGPARLSAAFSLPVVRTAASVDELRSGVDELGLGDLFVRPLGASFGGERAEVVASYGLYLPTGRFELGKANTSSGHVTHQFSAGGTLWLAGRALFVTALASYDLNQRKRRLDLTRGDLVQVQGGIGASVRGVAEVGLAGYGLWQVDDDAGADVPPPVRGARDRAFGVGPEVSIAIPYARTRLGLRAERDFAVEARPSGWVVVLGVTVQAWAPDAARP